MLGKIVVNRPANELCVLRETMIKDEATRDGEEAHLSSNIAIAYRCVLDEHRQLRLSRCEVRFSALTFGDIDKHIDGTSRSSKFIEQRCRIGDKRNPRAVRALGYRFHATDRAPLTQCQCHRTLVMRQRRTIRPVEFPGTAELALAKFGTAAPKLGRSLVVKGEAPLSVRHVNGRRKCLNRLPRQTVDVNLRNRPSVLPRAWSGAPFGSLQLLMLNSTRVDGRFHTKMRRTPLT